MIMTGSFQDSPGEGCWLLRGRKWRYFKSKYHPLRAVFAGLWTPQMGLGVKRAVTRPGRGDNHRVKARQIVTFCWAIFHSLHPSPHYIWYQPSLGEAFCNFLALSWLMDTSSKPQFDTMTKENYCEGEKWSHFLWLISGGTWNKTPLSNFILSLARQSYTKLQSEATFCLGVIGCRLFFVTGPDPYFNCGLLLLQGWNSYWMIHCRLITILTFLSSLHQQLLISHLPAEWKLVESFSKV